MNTNAQHTPGKWTTKIRQPGTMLTVENENGEYICSMLGGDEHKQENAALIASAPDLLSELKAAIRIFERDVVNVRPEQYERMRAAISQAEGGAQ